MNIKGPEDRSETAINEYHQLAAHQRPPPSILMAKERWSGTRSWCFPRCGHPSSTARPTLILPASVCLHKEVLGLKICLTASLPASIYLPFPIATTFLDRDSHERNSSGHQGQKACQGHVHNHVTCTQHVRYHMPTPLLSLSPVPQKPLAHVKMRNYTFDIIMSLRMPRMQLGPVAGLGWGWKDGRVGGEWKSVGCSEEQGGKHLHQQRS